MFPARDVGTVPKIALLSPSKVSTPAQNYVLRVVMVPIYVAGDIIFCPLLYLVVEFGGEGP